MATGAVASAGTCPQCGAERVVGATACWLCHAPLTGSATTPAGGWTGSNPYAAPQSSPTPPQFALSSLLLVVTLAALCVGLVTVAPGLIVPLVIFVLPAVIRTTIVTSRKTAAGETMSTGRKALTFLASIGIVYVVWMAGMVAFFGACAVVVGAAAISPSMNENLEYLLIALLIASAVGSLALAVWLFIKTLPRAK
jgi:hypothetical protein